jgi:hypothetical protein
MSEEHDDLMDPAKDARLQDEIARLEIRLAISNDSVHELMPLMDSAIVNNSPSWKIDSNCTIFHCAIEYGSTQILRWLIVSRNADLNGVGPYGLDLWEFARKHGYDLANV